MKKFLISLVLVAQWSIVNVWAQSLYAVNDGEGTLTFYYDGLRDTHQGATYTYENLETPAWNKAKDDITKVVFQPSVSKARPTTCQNWFQDFILLKEIEGLSYLNTSAVTSMKGMFESCKKLQSLDVSQFNTSNVTDMEQMFAYCPKLLTLDVSNFDMQKVTTIKRMFYNCFGLVTIYCNKDWKKSGVESKEMFDGCYHLMGGNGTILYWAEGGHYTQKLDVDYSTAHPDASGKKGLFTKKTLTIGGYYVKNGSQRMDCIKSGSVTYSEDDNELTLDNASIETSTEGIYAPEGVTITLIGTNDISSSGNGITIEGDDASIGGNGKLNINSANGYGISMGYMLEVYDKSGSPTLDVYGQLGALDGRKRWNSNLSKDLYGYLSPINADINLNTDELSPIVHNLGSIEGIDSDCFFNYLEYKFDKEQHTVVPPYNNEPVTKSFKIVGEEPEGYGIYLGGHLINSANYDNFAPQSLWSRIGKVTYNPDNDTLTLETARFYSPYWSSEDYYALYAHKNNLHILLKGENDLVGKADGCDYGIWLEQQGSGKQCNWTITSQDGATLRIDGDIYMTNDNPNSKLTIDNVDITCWNYCHLWCEDDVNVEIINSSLELWDKEYGQSDDFAWYLMGMMETLTLKDCHFENGCYWNPSKWMVFNSKGKPETYHVKIVRGGTATKMGDVNSDDKVNTADVVAVYTFIEKGTASGITRDAANVNGDANVNTADVVAIYDIIIKGN